jgi:hypothetical protein
VSKQTESRLSPHAADRGTVCRGVRVTTMAGGKHTGTYGDDLGVPCERNVISGDENLGILVDASGMAFAGEHLFDKWAVLGYTIDRKRRGGL